MVTSNLAFTGIATILIIKRTRRAIEIAAVVIISPIEIVISTVMMPTSRLIILDIIIMIIIVIAVVIITIKIILRSTGSMVTIKITGRTIFKPPSLSPTHPIVTLLLT